MEPITFPESNGTLTGGPAARFGTAKPVGDLPVHRGSGALISCWRPSLGERVWLLFGGRVWLRIRGEVTHPPISVEAQSPFIPSAARARRIRRALRKEAT